MNWEISESGRGLILDTKPVNHKTPVRTADLCVRFQTEYLTHTGSRCAMTSTFIATWSSISVHGNILISVYSIIYTETEKSRPNNLLRSQSPLSSISYFMFYSQLFSSGTTYISSNTHGPDDGIKSQIKPSAASSIETACKADQNGGV